MKKSKLDPSYYQQLLADQYDLLRHAFESFLVWELFGDLIRDTRVGEPRTILACISFSLSLSHSWPQLSIPSWSICTNSMIRAQRHWRPSSTWESEPAKSNLEVERILANRIAGVKAMAVKLNIRKLRNSSVGHYNATVEKRSPLTTVSPEPKEIRHYFEEVGEILNMCARRARFYQHPLHYDQNEHAISTLVGFLTGYISKGAAP